MASQEQRLKQLEDAQAQQGKSLVGVLTVDLTESLKAVEFRLHGFYLEEIDPAGKPAVPRICTDGIDIDAVVARANRMAELYTLLESLDPNARATLAAKRGFRVIYPAGTLVEGP